MLPKADRAKLVKEWQERFMDEEEYSAPLRQRYGDARRAIGLTQNDVAEILGVSVMAVRMWECGTVLPSTSHLMQMTKLYGLTAEQLTGY